LKEAKNIAKRIVLAALAMLAAAPMAVAQQDIDTLMRVSRNAVDKVIKYKAKDSVAMDGAPSSTATVPSTTTA